MAPKAVLVIMEEVGELKAVYLLRVQQSAFALLGCQHCIDIVRR